MTEIVDPIFGVRMAADRSFLYYRQDCHDLNVLVVIDLTDGKFELTSHSLEKESILDFKVVNRFLIYIVGEKEKVYKLCFRKLNKGNPSHETHCISSSSRLLIESANCSYNCFDVSPDLRYIVFGGTKNDGKKVKNIVSVETFRTPAPDGGIINSTFSQPSSANATLYSVQVLQSQSDRSNKRYYILYLTKQPSGFRLLCLSEEGNRLVMTQMFSTKTLNINFEKNNMVCSVANGTAAMVCDNKVIQILLKSKDGLTSTSHN